MAYKIQPYSYKQAEKLKVEIKPSKDSSKKIDIFKYGKKIASIGAIGYYDYPTYLELEKKGKFEKGYAEKRRALYMIRHAKDLIIRGSNGWYAAKILW